MTNLTTKLNSTKTTTTTIGRGGNCAHSAPLRLPIRSARPRFGQGKGKVDDVLPNRSEAAARFAAEPAAAAAASRGRKLSLGPEREWPSNGERSRRSERPRLKLAAPVDERRHCGLERSPAGRQPTPASAAQRKL